MIFLIKVQRENHKESLITEFENFFLACNFSFKSLSLGL
jgi:hypothetical protein